MTLQGGNDSEKPALNPAIIAAAAILLIIVLVGIGKHFLTGSSPSMAQKLDLDKHPIPDWVIQDARQCQGDIARLSPEEQAKVRAAYPGQGAVAIISAAYANQ